MHEDQNHLETDTTRGELIHTKPTTSCDINNDRILILTGLIAL